MFRRREKIDADTVSIDGCFNDVVRPVISSVFYPLPLALSYLCGNGFPFNLRAIWEANVSVNGNTVSRKLSLDPATVQAVLLADILRTKVHQAHSIDDLKDINERIYKRISVVHHDLIGNELDRDEKDIRKYSGNLPATLEEVIGRKDGKEHLDLISRIERPDKRIMIAHAGLQKEFVKLEDDKNLSYSEDPVKMLKDAGMLL